MNFSRSNEQRDFLDEKIQLEGFSEEINPWNFILISSGDVEITESVTFDRYVNPVKHMQVKYARILIYNYYRVAIDKKKQLYIWNFS